MSTGAASEEMEQLRARVVELEALEFAAITFVLAMDRLMAGPSTFQRGRSIAAALNRLQDAIPSVRPL